MRRKKPQKIYAFIDNQNLNATIQNLGWKIDWRKFRKFLSDKYKVNQAFMFIGYVPEFEDMYEYLHDAGFNIVLKQTYDMTKPRIEEEQSAPTPTNGEVRGPDSAKADAGKEEKAAERERHIKGNVDTELVLWAMKELPNYSKAILVSGDGDFYSLVEYLEEQGKLAKILTPSWQYSGLFNRYENYIVRIDKCRHELEYRKRPRQEEGSKSSNQKPQKPQTPGIG
jgi:uncharacterized LabA/DUF88 family protein